MRWLQDLAQKHPPSEGHAYACKLWGRSAGQAAGNVGRTGEAGESPPPSIDSQAAKGPLDVRVVGIDATAHLESDLRKKQTARHGSAAEDRQAFNQLGGTR